MLSETPRAGQVERGEIDIGNQQALRERHSPNGQCGLCEQLVANKQPALNAEHGMLERYELESL